MRFNRFSLSEMNYDTKVFFFNALLYSLIVVAGFVYCYARLDFVRSGPTITQETHSP